MVELGKMTQAELVTVQTGEQLSIPTSHAYKALVAAAAVKKITIKVSSPGGAYRSLAVAEEMRAASLKGGLAAKEWNLSTSSTIPLGVPGSHADGTRVDLLFNGSSLPNSTDIALAKQFGFTREFGNDDPNHFQHDGKTAIGATGSASVRKVAAYLNSRELGRTTTAVKDGVAGTNFYWLLQTAGHKDGLYKTPPYKIDGEDGPKTESLLAHYAKKVA